MTSTPHHTPDTVSHSNAVLDRGLVGVARLGRRRRRCGNKSQRRLCRLEAMVVGGHDYDLRGALPDWHAARQSELWLDVLALVSLRGTPSTSLSSYS